MASRREPSPPSLHARRILVVEDQFLIANELQDCLEKAGAEVVGPLGHMERALLTAEREALDAALLDIDLHGERCWPIADVLSRRAIPFIFATGYATDIVVPDRFAACEVLSKPFRERDMLAALAKLLAHRA